MTNCLQLCDICVTKSDEKQYPLDGDKFNK